jgi:FADH2 O2-dependent halogenase
VQQYDVVILGAGIGGSMLACILARRGLRVMLVEELSHPRFTIGESLIPETGLRLRILAEKHGVPEIGWLGNFYQLRDNVSSQCGVKRNFSFLYHREGQPARASEVNQLPTLTPPFGPDSHLFRQDTDAWLAAIAMHYGAEFQQQVKVLGVDFPGDEVVVRVAGGGDLRARFLIDAGGMRSHMATQFGLRDAVPRFRTDTRTLYSHFVGLKAADELVDAKAGAVHSPLSQGTFHHVFDGGWMWMIPFGNHREATNPLCSVGLMLDRRKHPAPTAAPEAEFRAFIARFPSIAHQFREARAVRPWVQSGRIQFSQSQLIGPRWLQLPHAATFVDPLYSSGMSVLTVAIDLIADALIPALAEDDLSVERFQRVQDVVTAGVDHYDLIVSRSFDAFADYDLWNAWNRNWVLGNYIGAYSALALLVRYLRSGDPAELAATTAPGRVGVLSSQVPEVRDVMLASAKDLDAATAGERSAREVSAQIFARLGALDFVPGFMGLGDAGQRSPTAFTLQDGVRLVLWYRHRGPERWRDQLDFALGTYGLHAARFTGEQLGLAARRLTAAVRDVVSPHNREWALPPQGLSARPGLAALPPVPRRAPPTAGEAR